MAVRGRRCRRPSGWRRAGGSGRRTRPCSSSLATSKVRPERRLEGGHEKPVVPSRQDARHRARGEAADPVRAEPLARFRHRQVAADLPAPRGAQGWTTFRACPSGSRIRTPFVKPSSRSGGAATLDDSRAQGPPRTARATASASSLASVVCQWTRSLARVSAGIGRPSRGVRYSRNSMPGPDGARSVVMRRRAPKTLFSRSCSGP